MLRESIGLWQAVVYSGGITASGGLLSRLAFLPEMLPEVREYRRAAAAAGGAAQDPEADLVAGRVTAFRPEQGFGVITLDDGRDVPFDGSNCTMVLEQGSTVRLRVGPARSGGLKALSVAPYDPTRPVAPASPPAQIWKPWSDRDITMLRWAAKHAAFLATADAAALLDHDRRAWCKNIDAALAAGPRDKPALDYTFGPLLDETPPPDAAINERLAALADLEYLGDELRTKARARIR